MSASAKHQGNAGIELTRVRRVMFVCLGNICRSPLAQGVFEHLAEARGVRDQVIVASSGTGGWHVGEPPDRRSIDVARRNGVTLRSRGQKLDPRRHFDAFDLLLAMDRQNLADMLAAGCPPDRAALFLSFAPGTLAATHSEPMRTLEVPDPYHGGAEGFDAVYQLVHAGAEGLLRGMFPELDGTERVHAD